MIRGIYTAGTGMITGQKRMDVLANNIVGSETTGFKADKLLSRSFRDILIERQNDPEPLRDKLVGPLNYGIHVDEVVTSFLQGPLIGTENKSDVAIAGNGFFCIQTEDGVRYTRDGAFKRDVTGLLTDGLGNSVLGEAGPITIETEDYVIDSQGQIMVDGEVLDRLLIQAFEDPGMLRKQGNNLYDNQGSPEAEFVGSIEQGFLEGSNVEMANEMVTMIEVSRNFESNQRILRIMDETLGKAVNDIARI